VVRRAKSEPRGHRSRKHKAPKRSNLLKMEASPKAEKFNVKKTLNAKILEEHNKNHLAHEEKYKKLKSILEVKE